jgi:hypothetical protein
MAKQKTPRLHGPDAAWQAESDLRTYLEWCVIKKDKTRLAAMRKLAQEKVGDYAKATAVGNRDHDGDE